MTRLLSFCTLFILLSSSLIAQSGTGNLKGSVLTSDGQPAVFVTLRLENTKYNTTTNEKGEYNIEAIKTGKYKLKVSAIGTVTQEKQIEIISGETIQIDFNLKESHSQLQEVTVTARNLNKENKIVSKMPLKNLENPQVYSTVSATTMNQQAITSYDDAFRNVPGMVRTWGATGRSGDGASYFALRGFEAQPSLVNGLPGITAGNLDPANIEEINVIKGPGGTLFGGSFYSYGGIINTVTKKPYYTFGGELSYKTGSFDLHRATADINIPLSKKEKIALRLNTAYHTENSFQDAGFKKSFFLAPSFAWEVNDRLSFLVMSEILQEKRAVPPVFFHSNRSHPLPFKTVEKLNLNNKLSFTSNDLTTQNPKFNLQAQMVYKLGGGWTSQTVFSAASVQSKGIYTYIWENGTAFNDDFGQFFKDQDYTKRTTDIQQNFNGEFMIGNMRNRLLIGLDYFHTAVEDRNGPTGRARNVTPQGAVNYIDPQTGDELPPVYLNKKSIYDFLETKGKRNNNNIANSSYSAYVSDVITLLPKLTAMVSLRLDYYDSKGNKSTKEDDYDQTAFSPKFGLVYEAVADKLSVFANYMNAFINVAPMAVSDKNGENGYVKSFRPEEANQFELGLKGNLIANKLQLTVSAYTTDVSNRVVGVAGNPNDYVQGGKVRSRGFELEGAAYPVAGLSIIGGYSFNRIKIVSGLGDDFYSQPGRNPGGQGPQHLANIWAHYKLTKGVLKHLAFGAGGNYGGEYKVIDNSATGVFVLPSYTLANAGIYYTVKRCTLSFNLNNVFNEVYYSGYWSINPQQPRNFVAGLAYSFK